MTDGVLLTIPTPKDEARFWAKVARGEHDACWNWTACTTGAKSLGWYGRFALRSRRYYAHRFAWCLARGFPLEYLTDELAILHTCDNPLCCNPSHLELGTQLDNIQDMIQKARHRNGHTKNAVQEIPV